MNVIRKITVLNEQNSVTFKIFSYFSYEKNSLNQQIQTFIVKI